MGYVVKVMGLNRSDMMLRYPDYGAHRPHIGTAPQVQLPWLPSASMHDELH